MLEMLWIIHSDRIQNLFKTCMIRLVDNAPCRLPPTALPHRSQQGYNARCNYIIQGIIIVKITYSLTIGDVQSNLTHSLSLKPVLNYGNFHYIIIYLIMCLLHDLNAISFYHILHSISYMIHSIFYKEFMFDMKNQKLLKWNYYIW